MTIVLREVPSQFQFLVFSSTGEGEWEEHEEPPLKIVRYANEFQQPKLPKSFCCFLKTLLSSTHCEYTIRCHNTANFSETEDVCSNFTGEHYHIFLYLKAFVGAENFIKESIIENITRAKPPLKIRNSFVKLFTVSYPENCIKREARCGGNRLFIHGERMKSMLQTKSTKDLGCKFENVWELQRSCYTEFDENEDAENLSYLCTKLAELQKSNAIFKDSVIDFINLLQRGFGNINIAHHNNVLKVDLGYSNAQCQCFECTEASGSVFEGNKRNEYKFDHNLFSFIDENAQFV